MSAWGKVNALLKRTEGIIVRSMKEIKDLFGERRLMKRHRSQRDEFVDFFFHKLENGHKGKKLSPSWVAIKLSHLKIPDLFYLKSICLDAENRGYPFGKVFWGSLKAK